MIYRAPEPKPATRLGANRELALWLVVMAFLTALVLTMANVPGQPQLAGPANTITGTVQATIVAFVNPTQGAGTPGMSGLRAFATPTLDYFNQSPLVAPIATAFPTPDLFVMTPSSSFGAPPALPTIGLPTAYPGPSGIQATPTAPGLFSSNLGATPTPGRAASTMTAVAEATAGTVAATSTLTATTSAYPGTGTPTVTPTP